MGAHAGGANRDTLGVTVCGNFENEQPERAQLTRLRALLAYWCQFYLVLPASIFGHRDVGTTATACPGRNLYSRLTGIRSEVGRGLTFARTLTWPG